MRRSKAMNILELPNDALTRVLRKLDFRELASSSATCSTVRDLADSDVLWDAHCLKWENEVPLKKWRENVKSSKELFRLLNSLSKLVGSWSSLELAPRGGLLHIVWGDMCVVASRVMPLWMSQGLVCRKMFKVLGERDGLWHASLLTGEARPEETTVPGFLVWDSFGKEFHLEKAPSKTESSEPSNSYSNTLFPSLSSTSHSSSLPHLEEDDIRVDQTAQPSPNPNNPNVLTSVERESIEHPTSNFLQRRSRVMSYLRRLSHMTSDQGYTESLYQLGVEGQNITTLNNSRGQNEIYGFTTLSLPSSRLLSPEPVDKFVPVSCYEKIVVQTPCPGRELAGLWTGIYGPHGLEILNVTYNDHREIIATKILGDPNVPCGEVTFKAYLDFENTEDTLNLSFSQLVSMALFYRSSSETPISEIAKLYAGHGRIAQLNFKQPQWVAGRLVVEKNGGMAFIWKDVDFAIRFSRLSIPSLLNQS